MKRARSRLGLMLVLGMLTALLPLGAVAPASAVTTHISEFHYDNIGTDAGEFIEVTGDAGTDLTDWTVALYNGNGGGVYNTIPLDVTIGDEGSGIGAVSFSLPTDGLQNGSPDGMALVDSTGVVLEFLSYEGVFSAVGGPADGMTSTDIGIAESSSTPIGDSLQYVGGIWVAGPSSPGVVNIPASTDPTAIGTATPGAVDPGESTTLEVTVVPGTNPDSTGITVTADLTAIGGSATEDLPNAGGTVFSYLATVDAGTTPGPVSLPVSISDAEGRSGSTSIALTVTDPTAPPAQILLTQYVEGSSYNKAIEIANLGTSDIDLSAYTLELYSNGSPTVSQSTALSGTLAGGDVYVMANSGAAAAILAVADDTNNSVINWNGDDAIVLRGPAGVVDSIGQVGFDPGSAWTGTGISTQNDTMCRLDTVTTGDTDPSDVFDPSLEWTGLGEDVFDGLGLPGCEPLPLLTQYVEGSSYNKAIEIANLGTGPIDLSNYTLELYSNGSPTVSQSATLSGTLAAGDVYVMAHADASAAILAVADTIDSSVINWNGDDAIVLRGPAGVVDSIGQVGVDPGAEWGDDTVGTQNDTLCRLDTVTSGDTDPSDAFDPSLEWTGLGEDVLWGLGEIGCEPPVTGPTFIHDIQGSGATSPIGGTTVQIEGIVIGDFQDGAAGTNGDLNGFYVQEEDADADADPATSEGIFVYDGYSPSVDVEIGDLVQVTGTVTDYGSSGSLETELTSLTEVTVVSSGNALPTATEVTLPYADVADLEQYEGMYVVFGASQNMYITEYFNFDRYGEIVITNDPRPAQPTAVYEPGSTEAEDLADLNARSRITLDDGLTSQNTVPARHPDGTDFTASHYFRGGDQLNNVVGVLSDSFGLYRIQPTGGATYTPTNPRTSAPDSVGGTLQVASFNVLNYFTTIDNGDYVCGPAQDLECRGADSVEELDRQRTKIVAALAAIDADVVGLIEIENNVATSVDEPLDNLVASLNAVVGAGTYNYVHTGSIGTDAIKVALIYKTASVTPSGDYAILDSSVDPLFDDTRNRPALAQTFTENGTDNEVTVVVNHLKSKGSSCGANDDDPEQGNCNLTRTKAATALVNWLGDSANGFAENVLVIGDLNSYDKEDPIDVFAAGGYADLALNFIGEDAYSYVFSGQWGYLDYALANSSVQPFVTGTTIWHINSDEADLLDYDTSYNDPMFYSPDAYRSSDHDPVVIGLDLTPPDTTAPVVTAEFDKLLVGFTTGLFKVDFSCVDDVDPDPTCVGDINGISVEDGQKVFLVQTRYGRSWHRQIGSVLYIKDSSFTLTVTGSDEAGNAATVTAEPEFRTWHWHNRIW